MHDARTRIDIITPDTLDAAAKTALIDELYAVQTRVFEGVSRELFATYVVDSDAAHSRLLVLRAGERAVGYLAFHVFERELDGRVAAIVRLESGYDPAFRGRSTAVPFFAAEILRTCLRYPLTPKYYLGCYVHPTAYVAMSRIAPLWPRPQRPTPARHQARMRALASSFALTPVAVADPGIHEVGWITRETPREASAWTRHPDPTARFFVTRNPGYARGHGLLVYARISALGLLTGALGLGRRRLRRWLERSSERFAATLHSSRDRGHGHAHPRDPEPAPQQAGQRHHDDERAHPHHRTAHGPDHRLRRA